MIVKEIAFSEGEIEAIYNHICNLANDNTPFERHGASIEIDGYTEGFGFLRDYTIHVRLSLDAETAYVSKPDEPYFTSVTVCSLNYFLMSEFGDEIYTNLDVEFYNRLRNYFQNLAK